MRHKDDSKGVGFQGHDDTWLEHQDDFQAVLAALNAEHGTEPKDRDEGSKSLEETSKKSKRRVHYQKFTRGKDLANYSADDLGCILGTKSDKVGEKKKRKEERIKLEEEEEAKKESELGKESKEHGYVTIQVRIDLVWLGLVSHGQCFLTRTSRSDVVISVFFTCLYIQTYGQKLSAEEVTHA